MILSQKLRDHAVANLGVAADASEDAFKSAIALALVNGKIDTKTIDSLVAEDDPQAKLQKMIDDRMDAAFSRFAQTLEKAKPVAEIPAGAEMPKNPAKSLPDNPADPRTLLMQGGPTGDGIRVKKASDCYDGTKSAAVWQKSQDSGEYAKDRPAFIWEGNGSGVAAPRYIDNPSRKEKAKMNAVFKHKLRGIPGMKDHVRMTEHEMELVKEAVHEDRWVGTLHKEEHYTGSRMLKDYDVKAVLDESGASVGAEAVPEYFDDAIIRTPLLSGELFPYVEVVPMARGSSVDGVKIGTPTFVSTAEGSAITPFSTTAFNTAFDTTIFPASVVFEWGLDFEADAVDGYIQQVIQQIGEESKRWLDEQIAIGDGTTEPQGIFVATNTAVSAIGTHTFSSFTYADIVNLAFGINKAHRNAFGGSFTRFVMNDPQYKSLLQIATGVTGDTRAIFGMAWKSYMLGDYPVSVQNNISNGNLGLCNLRGYRMYRRQGLQFLQDETGRTNRLAHTKLLMGRMRWGGQLTLAGYMGEMTT